MKFRRKTRATRKPRRYSRRKSYRSRRSLRVKPDGIVKEKITMVRDWVADLSLGGTPVVQAAHFLWIASNEADTPNHVFALNKGNDQHKQQARNYRFYKPYMMVIRYIPRDMIPTGQNDSLIRSIESASVPYVSEQNQHSDNEIKNALDYKIHTARMGFKRVYRIGKYLQNQKCPWIQTSNNLGLSEFQKMLTEVSAHGVNFNTGENGTYLGKFKVDYYVMYKSRQPDPV